jgi:hypothetical protein
MKKSLFIILSFAAFCGGCDLVGVLGTETYGNQKVPAQLDFSDIAKAGPLLVLVETSHGSRIPPDLPAKLRALIISGIVKKTPVKAKNIISPEKVEPLLARMRVFSGNRPLELAKAASAATVLYILIEDYRLTAVPQSQYHKGSLSVRGVVFDVASSKPLWPMAPATGTARSKVEFETEGAEATQNRIIAAVGHCIVRNFYNCKRSQYKINDEEANLTIDGVQNMGY